MSRKPWLACLIVLVGASMLVGAVVDDRAKTEEIVINATYLTNPAYPPVWEAMTGLDYDEFMVRLPHVGPPGLYRVDVVVLDPQGNVEERDSRLELVVAP